MTTPAEKKNLKDYTLEELKVLVDAMGERPFRAGQLYCWVFKKHARSIDAMTDVSLGFRRTLSEGGFYISSPRPGDMVEIRSSTDGTTKFLLELEDGSRVESVLIPQLSDGKRLTLCVSTQTGCSLGCAFCMTGSMGPGRDLTLSEMVSQLEEAEALAGAGKVKGHLSVTNVVIMGMGEPLLNYDEVVKFLRVLTDDKAMGFGPRKVTLSTAGVAPAIKKLGRDAIVNSINLAVSLNATTNKVRSALMPINRKYPLKELMAALRGYPLKKRGAFTIEYVLIKGVNDTDADARRLVKLLRGLPSKVNLIPFNPFPGSEFKPPTTERLLTFQKILLNAGLTAVKRESRGADIQAACGQLKGHPEGV